MPGRRLWYARARLLADRVELSGWGPGGRYRRHVPLAEVEAAEWWATEGGPNFALHLHAGDALTLRLKRGAGTWKVEVDRLLGQATLRQADVPTDTSPRASAA